MKQIDLAFQDLIQGIKSFAVWSNLGALEVKQRYQRSVLGPWWVSISMLIFVVVLGSVFSRVFSISLAQYMPYFSAGYLLWLYISSCINESTELFRQNSGFIKQIKLPFSVYVFKFLTKNIVIFFHNFLVFLLVLLYFRVSIGWVALLAIPGFILLSANLYWISFLVALISTRFRDMVPIINSSIQMLFFATPISWDRKLLGTESKIVNFNPLVYFIDLVREPLLGNCPPLSSWMIVVSIACLGLGFAFFSFSRVRSRIPFWVD
jgi:lipopolysaccharide transport system permease protein